MTPELPIQYRFDNGGSSNEEVLVYKSIETLCHRKDRQDIQRLTILRDPEYNNNYYLQYHRFKGYLWAGLTIRPAYPDTDLHDFYLGKDRGNGLLHGFCYTKGCLNPSYMFQDSGNTTFSEIFGETSIDWNKMCSAKKFDLKGAFISDHKDETYENSFVCRLVPAPGSPTAQISYSENFNPNDTFSLDTSAMIDSKDFEYFIKKGLEMINANRFSKQDVQDFCGDLHLSMNPYFPVQ